jgi:hypothetical protein
MYTSFRNTTYRRGWIVLAAVAAGAAGVLCLASCESTSHGPHEEVLPNTGKPALHAVYGDELKLAMRHLQRRYMSQMRAELYSGDRFRPDMDRVAADAESLAESASRLPDALKGVHISDADRRVFIGLAEKLRDEALDLKRQANERHFSNAEATLGRITATCNACHTTFRALPNVPESPG